MPNDNDSQRSDDEVADEFIERKEAMARQQDVLNRFNQDPSELVVALFPQDNVFNINFFDIQLKLRSPLFANSRGLSQVTGQEKKIGVFNLASFRLLQLASLQGSVLTIRISNSGLKAIILAENSNDQYAENFIQSLELLFNDAFIRPVAIYCDLLISATFLNFRGLLDVPVYLPRIAYVFIGSGFDILFGLLGGALTSLYRNMQKQYRERPNYRNRMACLYFFIQLLAQKAFELQNNAGNSMLLIDSAANLPLTFLETVFIRHFTRHPTYCPVMTWTKISLRAVIQLIVPIALLFLVLTPDLHISVVDSLLLAVSGLFDQGINGLLYETLILTCLPGSTRAARPYQTYRLDSACQVLEHQEAEVKRNHPVPELRDPVPIGDDKHIIVSNELLPALPCISPIISQADNSISPPPIETASTSHSSERGLGPETSENSSHSNEASRADTASQLLPISPQALADGGRAAASDEKHRSLPRSEASNEVPQRDVELVSLPSLSCGSGSSSCIGMGINPHILLNYVAASPQAPVDTDQNEEHQPASPSDAKHSAPQQ